MSCNHAVFFLVSLALLLSSVSCNEQYVGCTDTAPSTENFPFSDFASPAVEYCSTACYYGSYSYIGVQVVSAPDSMYCGCYSSEPVFGSSYCTNSILSPQGPSIPAGSNADSWAIYPTSASGLGSGDPVFVDFNNTRFNFNGHANGVYHIFSDLFMSINALFAFANPSLREKGTVMGVIAVQVGENQIVFSVEESKNIGVSLNNKTLVHGDKVTVGCVSVTLPKPGNCEVSTPHHHFAVSTRTESTVHINTTYLNFNLKLSGEQISSIGGLLRVSDHKKDNEKLFIASDLFSTDAPSNKFLHALLQCSAGVLNVKGKNIKEARSSIH